MELQLSFYYPITALLSSPKPHTLGGNVSPAACTSQGYFQKPSSDGMTALNEQDRSHRHR